MKKVIEYIRSNPNNITVLDIQKRLNMGFGSVIHIIDELVEQGLIEPHKKQNNIYKVKKVERMIKNIQYYKGEILPIVGRPGIGQESIVLNIASEYSELNPRKPKDVIIFSPIQPKIDIQTRIVCIQHPYSYHYLSGGYMKKELQERANGFIRGLNFSHLIVDDTEDIDERYIFNQMLDRDNVGMIVMLDYDFISHKVSVPFLESIAKDYDIPIVISALVSREVENRDDYHPTRADIKNKHLKAQDTVLLVYREGYYDLDNNEGDAELFIDRRGEVNREELFYCSARMKFLLPSEVTCKSTSKK